MKIFIAACGPVDRVVSLAELARGFAVRLKSDGHEIVSRWHESDSFHCTRNVLDASLEDIREAQAGDDYDLSHSDCVLCFSFGADTLGGLGQARLGLSVGLPLVFLTLGHGAFPFFAYSEGAVRFGDAISAFEHLKAEHARREKEGR